jgi:hypothetical protein
MKDEANLRQERISLTKTALCLLLGGASSLQVFAQESATSSRVEESLESRRTQIQAALDREGLTRHWFGIGDEFARYGLRFEAGLTFFGSAPYASDESATYGGGKFNGLLKADLHQLGLWNGLRLTVHPEYNFGEAANQFGGAVLPLNVAMQLPGASDGRRYDTSSLFLTQRINDTFSLVLGKSNLADITAFHPYAGGVGVTGFMNGGLAAAPHGALPPYVYGGVLAAKLPKAILSLGVYGGSSARGSLDFGEAFDQGYILSGGVSVPVRPAGLPGRHDLTLVWGDREAAGAAGQADLNLSTGPSTLESFDTRRTVLRYAFHQQLGRWGSGDRGWGVWGRAGIGENELTAVAWSMTGGIGGDSPISGRGDDRWGLGAFYYSFADYLKDPAITPVSLADERGVEFFYNAWINSWLRVTGDVQVVNPAAGRGDSIFALSLRASIRF